MKTQKWWVAFCLVGACSVGAQERDSYAEISYQVIDVGFKTDARALRGVLGTSVTGWMDVEAMVGASFKEAQDVPKNVLNYVPTANVDRHFGVYVKPKLKPSPGLELFGRLGYASTQITIKDLELQNNQPVWLRLTTTERDFSYGVGASYAIKPWLIIGMDYMSFAKEVDALSMGIRYGF